MVSEIISLAYFPFHPHVFVEPYAPPVPLLFYLVGSGCADKAGLEQFVIDPGHRQDTDGRLAVIGSKVFWSQFIIWFPNKKYQKIVGIDKEFLSLSSKGLEYENRSVTDVNAANYVTTKPIITRTWTTPSGHSKMGWQA